MDQTTQETPKKEANKPTLNPTKAKNKPTTKEPKQTRFRLGRPTKYKIGYCQDIIDFFTQELYTQRIKSTITQKNGSVVENYELVPNPPVFFGEYAYSIGTTTKTLLDWCKLFPDFSKAYMRAKQLQQEHINKLANMGLYNSNYAQFTMVNISDWRLRNSVELSGKVESQVFFANMLSQSEQALENERKVLGKRSLN